MIGGISIWQLLIVLVIILVLFGTKKLRSLGSDLGGAVQGFKKSLKDDGQQEDDQVADDAAQPELDPMAEEVATAAKQTADQQKTS